MILQPVEQRNNRLESSKYNEEEVYEKILIVIFWLFVYAYWRKNIILRVQLQHLTSLGACNTHRFNMYQN